MSHQQDVGHMQQAIPRQQAIPGSRAAAEQEAIELGQGSMHY